jgi:hypothetical protein
MLHNRTKTKLRFYTALMAICLTFCLVPGLVACQAISKGTPTPQGTVLSFETIEQQDYSSGTGILYDPETPGIMIVSKVEDISSLNELVAENSLSQLRSLNYDQYFAIAVFQGLKRDTGHGIQIDQVVRRENSVNIFVSIHDPKPGEPTGAMETSPYHLVRIQKTGNWGQEITFNLMADDQLVTSAVHMIP